MLRRKNKRLSSPLIYVCSPYRGDVKLNTENACAYCRLVMKQGGIPFAPHLFFTRLLDDSNEAERQQGLQLGLEMLKLCDELWVYGTPSEGMRMEIDQAAHWKIPVRYHDLSGRRLA